MISSKRYASLGYLQAGGIPPIGFEELVYRMVSHDLVEYGSRSNPRANSVGSGHDRTF